MASPAVRVGLPVAVSSGNADARSSSSRKTYCSGKRSQTQACQHGRLRATELMQQTVVEYYGEP